MKSPFLIGKRVTLRAVELEDDATFAAFARDEIQRVVVCSGGEPTVDSWTRVLLAEPVRDAAGLDRLAEQLAELEESAVSRAERRTANRR